MHAHAQSCLTLCNSVVAQQALLSMEYSRQECWSGLPFPLPGDLPDPGLNPHLLCLLPCLAAGFLTTVLPGKLHVVTFLPPFSHVSRETC